MKIVILKHVFHPSDAKAAYNFYDELHDELEAKLEQFGELEKITVRASRFDRP